jgi:type IV pilus assembly protein PilB
MPGKTIDFRVSIMPSVHGEDSVIRILDKESISEQFTELRLDILGFPELELKRFRKYIAEPYGMVLVTGPTGSGKTTTLYAALSEIKSIEDKIVTIEDPVEYQLRGITQIPINEKKGLTFARGLRSILRHDPDKIMVGEIRDNETGADRHQLGADRAPRLHHRAREQRARRARTLPQHGRRGLSVRVGVELRHGAAAGAHDLRALQASREGDALMLEESRLDPALEHTHTSTKASAASSAAAPATRAAPRSANCSTSPTTFASSFSRSVRRPRSRRRRAKKACGSCANRRSRRVMSGTTSLREINKVTFVE